MHELPYREMSKSGTIRLALDASLKVPDLTISVYSIRQIIPISYFWSHSLVFSFSFYVLASHPALGCQRESKVARVRQKNITK